MSVLLICDVQSNGGGKNQAEGSQSAEDTIKKHCPKKEKQFFDRKNNVWVKFNLEQEFEENGKDLEETKPGLIKEVCYPSIEDIEGYPESVTEIDLTNWPVKVAVKKVNIRSLKLNEIVVLEKVSDGEYGLIYYGCRLSNDEQNVYLVQEKLVGDFFQGDAQTNLLALRPKERLWFYRQLFEQVIKLNNDEFVHNDIKLDNMMFDSTQKRFVIFDFGLAQQKDTPLNADGSYWYISPGKYPNFRDRRKASLIDDLYSLAITIGMIEGGTKEVHVGTYFETIKKNKIKFDRASFPINDFKTIRTNVERILESRGFADCLEDFKKVKLKSVDELTFANLISLSIYYFGFKLTGIEVMQIIDRELGDMKDRTLMLKFEPNPSKLVCPGDQNHRLVI